jgi:hypothetical protein
MHRSLLRPFLEPGPVPILFITGIVLLSLIGNAVYEALRDLFAGPILVGLIALALFFLLAIAYALLNYYRTPSLKVRDLQPKAGLITLVSRGKLSELSATAAIKLHYRGEQDEREAPVLRHCWLITSPKSVDDEDETAVASSGTIQSAWKNARDLQSQYQNQIKVHIKQVDPENPESVFNAVEQAYQEARWLGLRSEEMVADFTGGTKVMTVGMALACTSTNRLLSYMQPRRVDEKGFVKPEYGSEPKALDLHFLIGTITNGRDQQQV